MPNELNVIITADGSKTCLHPEHRASYRSIHGAVTEVRHVFICTTLLPLIETSYLSDNTLEVDSNGGTHRAPVGTKESPISVLEFGFGLGTSFGETYLFAKENSLYIRYLSIEREPVAPRYAQHPDPVARDAIVSLLSPLQEGKAEAYFSDSYIDATVIKTDFLYFDRPFLADAIYFDPFGPSENADSWTSEVFQVAANHLAVGGRLATYSVAGKVRRAMEAAGFCVKKVPGPPHKREICVATLP